MRGTLAAEDLGLPRQVPFPEGPLLSVLPPPMRAGPLSPLLGEPDSCAKETDSGQARAVVSARSHTRLIPDP